MSEHYKMILAATSQSVQEQKKVISQKPLGRKVEAWVYALVISFIPFLIVFLFSWAFP